MNRCRTLNAEQQTAWREHCELDAGADEVVLELFTLAAFGPCDEAKAREILARYEAKREGADDALNRFNGATRAIENGS